MARVLVLDVTIMKNNKELAGVLTVSDDTGMLLDDNSEYSDVFEITEDICDLIEIQESVYEIHLIGDSTIEDVLEVLKASYTVTEDEHYDSYSDFDKPILVKELCLDFKPIEDSHMRELGGAVFEANDGKHPNLVVYEVSSVGAHRDILGDANLFTVVYKDGSSEFFDAIKNKTYAESECDSQKIDSQMNMCFVELEEIKTVEVPKDSTITKIGMHYILSDSYGNELVIPHPYQIREVNGSLIGFVPEFDELDEMDINVEIDSNKYDIICYTI